MKHRMQCRSDDDRREVHAANVFITASTASDNNVCN